VKNHSNNEEESKNDHLDKQSSKNEVLPLTHGGRCICTGKYRAVAPTSTSRSSANVNTAPLIPNTIAQSSSPQSPLAPTLQQRQSVLVPPFCDLRSGLAGRKLYYRLPVLQRTTSSIDLAGLIVFATKQQLWQIAPPTYAILAAHASIKIPGLINRRTFPNPHRSPRDNGFPNLLRRALIPNRNSHHPATARCRPRITERRHQASHIPRPNCRRGPILVNDPATIIANAPASRGDYTRCIHSLLSSPNNRQRCQEGVRRNLYATYPRPDARCQQGRAAGDASERSGREYKA